MEDDFASDEPVMVNERAELVFIRNYMSLVVETLPKFKENAFCRIWQMYDADDELDRLAGEMVQKRVEDGVTVRFLLASSVIANITMYEMVARKALSYLASWRGTSLKLRSLRGSFLVQIQMYSSEVLGVELHRPDEWEYLRDVYAVRNAFTHANGSFGFVSAGNDKKRLESLLDRGHLSLWKHETIIIPEVFVREVADRVGEITDRLIVTTRVHLGQGSDEVADA